jgi:hypothetical protein
VERPELLGRFMSAAGYSPQTLRAAAGSRPLSLGLIDFFAENESLLVAVCERNSLRPEDFMRTRAKLNAAGR